MTVLSSSFPKFLKTFRSFVFRDYKDELKRVTNGCQSLLDVGCGKGSPVQYLPASLYSVGVDIFEPALEMSKKQGIHTSYEKMNVLDIGQHFEAHSFDCVLASDLIEHLTKEDGLRLITQMEDIAKEKVIIFTPNGFVEQGEYEDNPWQEHKSGWTVAEMRDYGYESVGINGARWVWNIQWLWQKRESAPILIRLIRALLVDITQVFTRTHPQYAFQILCIKTK